MKKIVFAAVLGFVVVTSCQTRQNKGSEKGNLLSNDFRNSAMENKTFEVGSFSRIEAGSVMKVVIRKSAVNKVVVSSNAMPYVVVKNVGGILKLSYNTPNKGLNNVETEAIVYTTGFSSLKGSSAAKIVMEEGLKPDRLSVELNGAGKLDGVVDAKQLSVNLKSAAKMTVKIKADSMNVKLNEVSKLTADLDVDVLKVYADSASKAVFSGKANDVNAEANSVAKIDLTKLALKTVQTTTSSMGKISQ